MDILDLYRGRESPVVVLMLVGQIPISGAYPAAWIRDHPEAAATNPVTELPWRDWTMTNTQLATVIDLLQSGNWQRGGGKGKKPDPSPRPSATAKKKPTTLRERMRAATNT